MRDFKKYFFETLIQLAILANVFRGNNRHPTDVNHNVMQTIELNSTSSELDYLFLSNNIYSPAAPPFYHYPQNFSTEIENDNNYMNSNFRGKEAQSYVNDIRWIQRLNRLGSRQSPSPISNTQNFLFVAPASFSYNSNNQKELNRLSETRLLLNSIETSNNQFNKEV